jgi:hypothetical protein
MSKKDKVTIEDKKHELVYEGGIEVLDGSDNQLDNIRNSFLKNSSIPTTHKEETHLNKDKVNIGDKFTNGDRGGAITNISNVINKSRHLELEEIVLIKNKTDEMIKNSTKEKIIEGCTYLVNLSENSTKKTNPSAIERKKFLESIGKLFAAIKEGCENGFNKSKDAINSAFEKVKSLGRDKITVITDKGSKPTTDKDHTR